MAITDPVEPPKAEIGYAGVQPPAPTSWATWAVAGDDSDEVPALQWPNSVAVYHRMRTDSQIDALSRAITLPIRNFKWRIKPNGARDEAVEQIASDFGVPIVGEKEPPPRGRRRFNHDDHLRHALLALWYGHMFMEQVPDDRYDLATDGWRLGKLAPRMPQSIARILVEPDGGLAGIQQHGNLQANKPARRTRQAILGVYGPEPIPVSALVAYVWDREGANWTGRSMYRPTYRHWLTKDRLIKIDAIKNERYGVGIPTGKAPKGSTNVGKYAEAAQSVRAGERSGLGVPDGGEVYVEGIRGQLPDTIGSIRYHDEAMARQFLAMFIQLGQTETGSRALGQTFVDFFDLATRAVANWYATTTNVYAIEDMVDWNWGTDENAPLMVWEEDEEEPISIEELVNLIDSGALAIDAELDQWIRDRYRLPAKQEIDGDAPTAPSYGYDLDYGILTIDERRAQIGLPPLPNGEGAGLPVPATVRDQVDVAAVNAQRAKAGRKPLPRQRLTVARSQTVGNPKVGHRDPTDIEVRAATNFAQVQQVWETQTTSLVDSWADIKAQQIDALIADIEAAVEAADATALASLSAPVLGVDVIGDQMVAMAEESITAARAEAAAQGVTIGLLDIADLEPLLRSRAEAVASLLSRSISEAAARQALQRYGAEVLDPAVVAEGVRAHLDELGDSYLNDQLGGALTQAQNTGRLAVMSQAPARIYGSELLDQNTCENCVDVDGTEYGSPSEAQADYPTGGYSECLGGPRCRGTLVAVYDEATASADEE